MLDSLRVAVAGGGPAGLAALKELALAGADVTCFEKGDRIGGIWAFENSSGLSSAYETLHLNTSKARTEFADFPLPKDCPDYPSHYVIGEYFERFVDQFDLRRRIRYETGVERADLGAQGEWELTLEDGTRESFDALVVASGHNWDPRFPDPPYPGGFAGEQIHAHDFRETRSSRDAACWSSGSATPRWTSPSSLRGSRNGPTYPRATAAASCRSTCSASPPTRSPRR